MPWLYTSTEYSGVISICYQLHTATIVAVQSDYRTSQTLCTCDCLQIASMVRMKATLPEWSWKHCYWWHWGTKIHLRSNGSALAVFFFFISAMHRCDQCYCALCYCRSFLKILLYFATLHRVLQLAVSSSNQVKLSFYRECCGIICPPVMTTETNCLILFLTSNISECLGSIC